MDQFSEDLFSAIDIIVQERLKDLTYDKTLLCTVVKNNESNSGKYSVSYQNLIFDAYSENTTYQINDQVYVIIPENQDNTQKIIIGKVIANATVTKSLHPADNLIIYGKLKADNTNNFIVPKDVLTNIPSHLVVSGYFSSIEKTRNKSNENKIEIILTYTNNKTDIITFTQLQMVGSSIQLVNSLQEKMFSLNNFKGSTLKNIDIKLYNLKVSDLQLIFGEPITNNISNFNNSIVLVNSLYDLSYKEKDETKEFYSTYLYKNNIGSIVKGPNEIIQYQKYIITGYNDVNINAAWSDYEISYSNNCSFKTDTKYPYERFRAVVNGISSQPITFINSAWEGGNEFDNIVIGADLYLSINALPEENNDNINIITNNSTKKCKINCKLCDTYDNSIIQNNLMNVQLSWVTGSFLNVSTIEDNSFTILDPTQPAYGILYGAVLYEGNYYTSYSPISWRINTNYYNFTGPKMVTYNEFGSDPSFSNIAYSLNDVNIIWETNKLNNVNYPKISPNNTLIPLNTYLSNQINDFQVIGKKESQVVWIQPVAITQSTSIESNVELGQNLMSSTIISLGKISDDSVSGVFIGTKKLDTPEKEPESGVFSFLKEKPIFSLTDLEVILGKFNGIREDSSDQDKSYIQFNFSKNGNNEIVSKGRAAAQEDQGQTEETLRAAAGFKIDLSKDKIESKFLSLGNTPEEVNIGNCALGQLEDSTVGLLIKPKNINEKVITGNENNIQDNWLVTLAYIKKLEERIAALEQQ